MVNIKSKSNLSKQSSAIINLRGVSTKLYFNLKYNLSEIIFVSEFSFTHNAGLKRV